MLSDDERKRIADALTAAKVRIRCPMCDNERFTVLDGYINNPVQDQPSAMTIGGPSIPVAAVVCERCGFLSQHALGVLKLLVREAKKP